MKAKLSSRAVVAGAAISLALAAAIVGCATLGGNAPGPPPTTMQTIDYYPHLVKGYQNSYPARRVLILMPMDDRAFKDPAERDHEPLNGNPAIGTTLDQNAEVIQRIFAVPLAPVVQKALEQAAEEAGLVPLNSDQTVYAAVAKLGEDYVLETRIVRCWVQKQRGPNTRYGPTWLTSAHFTIDATLYKPPFHAAFWSGRSPAGYEDPPLTSSARMDNETGIYDEPGQVLSIALTRSVAGVFKDATLRELISADRGLMPNG